MLTPYKKMNTIKFERQPIALFFLFFESCLKIAWENLIVPNNSNITKKLKIAFKRWSKQCKAAGWDGFSEPYMASALFMIKISQKRQQNQDKTFDELLKIVQKENDDHFTEQQEKQLIRARLFAEAQKLSDQETTELINNTKEKLAIELKSYQVQKNKLKNGEDIQREMFEIGFCETIKFDGGRGLWVESEIFNAGEQGKANKSGFAIRRKKL